MKVLVIEDDAAMRSYLKKGFAEAGFVVDLAPNGLDGAHMATSEDYDIVVLDVTLPNMDGWQVLKLIRAAGRNVPVLMLSAHQRVEDRIRGLDLGADDYLCKPFDFGELLARVRARTQSRAAAEAQPEILSAADLEMNISRHRVTRAGRRIQLTPKEFALLELLLRRQGEVLPRALIISQIWEFNFDSDTNVLEAVVFRLRMKVDDGFEPKLIRTVRGVGYSIDAAAEAS